MKEDSITGRLRHTLVGYSEAHNGAQLIAYGATIAMILVLMRLVPQGPVGDRRGGQITATGSFFSSLTEAQAQWRPAARERSAHQLIGPLPHPDPVSPYRAVPSPRADAPPASSIAAADVPGAAGPLSGARASAWPGARAVGVWTMLGLAAAWKPAVMAGKAPLRGAHALPDRERPARS